MKRILLTVESSFEADHRLPRHRKCGKTHGHSYKLRFWFEIELPETPYFSSLTVDFGDLKTMVNDIAKRFDHRSLNDFLPYPSCENILLYISRMLTPYAKYYKPAKVVKIEIWEGKEHAVLEL